MKLPEPPKNEFEIPPIGTHAARCYRFVDVGTQIVEYKGEKKTVHQVMIGWEFPTEKMKDGRPFSVHKTYTWSMSDKATLRKHLEAWRGRKFSDTDFGPGGFDTRKLIGATCMIGISHSETNGKTYSNISSIGPAVKGMEIPPSANEPIYFSLDDFSPTIFDGLSDALKEKIKKSPEYSRATGQVEEDAHRPHEELDDEIPF